MKITYPVFLSILEKVRELNNEEHDTMILLELCVNQNVSFISGIIKLNYNKSFSIANLRVIFDVLESWSVEIVNFDKNCILFNLPFDSSI